MASKTIRKQSSTRGLKRPVQPDAEGLLLLPLHLHAEAPCGLQVNSEPVGMRAEDERAAGGSVIVIDLDPEEE